MYRVGIIGDRESVLGFRSIGFDVADIADLTVAAGLEAAEAALRRFISNFYAIIFVTEQVAIGLDEIIDQYKDAPTPAIIVLPNNQGTNGMGMSAIKKSVERAVGADILFKDS